MADWQTMRRISQPPLASISTVGNTSRCYFEREQIPVKQKWRCHIYFKGMRAKRARRISQHECFLKVFGRMRCERQWKNRRPHRSRWALTELFAVVGKVVIVSVEERKDRIPRQENITVLFRSFYRAEIFRLGWSLINMRCSYNGIPRVQRRQTARSCHSMCTHPWWSRRTK